MPRAIGANCRLLMLPETVYGTAPGSNWRRMPFLSCDLGAEQGRIDPAFQGRRLRDHEADSGSDDHRTEVDRDLVGLQGVAQAAHAVTFRARWLLRPVGSASVQISVGRGEPSAAIGRPVH